MQPLDTNIFGIADGRPIIQLNEPFLRTTYKPEAIQRTEPLIYISSSYEIERRLDAPSQILGNTGHLVPIRPSRELQQAMVNDFAFNHGLLLKNLIEQTEFAEMWPVNELQLSVMLNTICRGRHTTVFPVADRPTTVGLVRWQLPKVWHETRLLAQGANLNLMRQNMMMTYNRWAQENNMATAPRLSLRQSSLHIDEADGEIIISACNEVSSVVL